ncbi:MAG: 4Fe-4S binding protein [Chloroflexi bacterium]|jgi:polyferredoxin|nr:4Fe-4S binding protein [Chloroflexota bacterium]MBT3670391.1 4Fe-4S binding protein [Chloroflexota bacterium]MBT4002034.1 4Fe-4S binding protein [Chloroflexota bacterium]MBT4305578.1 4Fe-4S binding protein [Chloroflexota bacterium]MBT4533190.1 4Fe-4S binding protein [Chloroflexota bacterium]
MKKLRGVLLVLISLGVLTICLLAFPSAGKAGNDGVREIVIHARAFEYTPRLITVQKGETIKLTLIADDVTHGLVLEKYGVKLEASPRAEVPSSVTFVANEGGKFHFRCTVVCGPFHAFMVGEFVVEPYNKLSIAWSLTLVVAGMAIIGVQRYGDNKEKDPVPSWSFELTKFKWVRTLLKQRWFQFALMLPNAFFFVVILVAAFFGSPIGNANFAIIFVWIVWWAALKFFFIPIGGRLFCSMCPLPLPGDWLEHKALVKKGHESPVSKARKGWPKGLRNLWTQNIGFLSVCLFSGLILTRPIATGIVLSLFIIGAAVTSVKYGRRVFCRYICPVSGFTGMYSMVAPVEIRAIDPQVCAEHTDKTCITGSEDGYGCPWLNYPGGLERNSYCGMCTECFKTCPEDNIALNIRPFGRDLFVYSGRGVDEVYNGFIMLACALIYIAVFLGPWGVLKDMANIATVPLYLAYAVAFILTNLVILPGLFYVAVWLGKGWAEGKMTPAKEAFNFVPIVWQNFLALFKKGVKGPKFPKNKSNVHLMDMGLPPVQKLFTEYGYTIIPLGLAGWIAFTVAFALVDISYAIPLLSDPMGWGWDLFGTASAEWVMYVPHLVPFFQIPIMLVGMVVAIYVVYRIGIHHISNKKMLLKSLAPVFFYIIMITGFFFWLVL